MTAVKVERRATIELRAAGRKLEGYAALFGKPARILDFTETIAPGAFTETLRESKDILALVDHDRAKLLGRTRAGTLSLSQDAKGLAFSIEAPDTSLAHDVLALAERGDMGGASFAFRVRPNGERWDEGMKRRELRAVDLLEVSIITAWPAYEGTKVFARTAPRTSFVTRYLETCKWAC